MLISSVSLENHCFPCKSSVFGLMLIQSLFLILVSGSCFFVIVLFVPCSMMFLCFFYACCPVLAESQS